MATPTETIGHCSDATGEKMALMKYMLEEIYCCLYVAAPKIWVVIIIMGLVIHRPLDSTTITYPLELYCQA